MTKKQTLFPISSEATTEGLSVMAHLTEGDLRVLKADYLRLPVKDNHIIPPLLHMEARDDIKHDPTKRKPYRAGVMLGSYFGRHQLHTIGIKPAVVFSQEVAGNVNWSGMLGLRFALRQYFDEGAKVKHHIYQAIEQPWAKQNNSFSTPEAKDHEPVVDWMLVGLGDTMRLCELAYAKHTGVDARRPIIVSIDTGTTQPA